MLLYPAPSSCGKIYYAPYSLPCASHRDLTLSSQLSPVPAHSHSLPVASIARAFPHSCRRHRVGILDASTPPPLPRWPPSAPPPLPRWLPGACITGPRSSDPSPRRGLHAARTTFIPRSFSTSALPPPQGPFATSAPSGPIRMSCQHGLHDVPLSPSLSSSLSDLHCMCCKPGAHRQETGRVKGPCLVLVIE